MGSFPRLAARIFAFAIGIAALAAAPAHAEREPSANNGKWVTVNAGGCSLILNMGALYLSPDGRFAEDTNWPATITWSGPCGANGLANGRGTMTIAVYFKEANFSTDYRSTYAGEMRDGIMSGGFSLQSLNNDGNGNYTSNYPAENTTYTNGCDTEWDFNGECKLADAQLLQKRFGAGAGAGPGKGGAPAPVSAGAPAPADGSSYAGGTTYTTVGGTAVAPPTFAAPQEKALAAVSDGVVSALGGRSGIGFSSGDVTVDAIIASLRSTFQLNNYAALGGKNDDLTTVLAAVRKALGGANPASTNGQIADLVMDTVRLALAKTPGAKGAAPKAPGPKPAPKAAGAKAPGATGAPATASYAAPAKAVVPPPAPATATAPKTAAGGKGGGAKMVSAAKLQSVIDYLASKGSTVTRGTDAEGKPKLTEAANLYQVMFYDCSEAKDQCKTLQFNACYDHYPKANVTKTNEWSAGYVKIKAYIDSNGWVCLDQAVPTGIGGVSYEAMDLSYDAFIWFTENADSQFK